ncbi:hypothetical protein [Nocardia wallacei]|uniref:hypothetical protein n=1 Tax=Nocardia wallacei TaxID=480035 RepID=UPI002454DD8A|nr:hypothetical protein [Nocardia wallacei]
MPTKGVQTVDQIVGDIADLLADAFDQIGWGEDEIAAAQARHPNSANKLHHAFALLRATSDLLGNEELYRAHCREILKRVVTGQDTRPGSAAEICAMMCEISQRTPMNTTATGLYMRAWKLAGLPGDHFDHVLHYEAIRGSAIDDLEAEVRHKLAVPDRILYVDHCAGLHHGEVVACEFANRTPDAAAAA